MGIEDPKEPSKFKTVGVCTEKWIEVIRASKQTDTEDFAYKDTESPRVADIPLEPLMELPERRQRLSSLTSPCLRKSNSPSVSRKSSSASTTQTTKADHKSKGTMMMGEVKMKMPTKDVKVGDNIETKTVA